MKQPFSFPRRVFCARVLLFRFAPPIEGWRSAESRRVLARHPLGLHLTRQARRLRGALRPITRDARLSALSPWRFLAPVPRLPHPPCVRVGHSELLSPGSYCPAGGFSFLPGQRVGAAGAGRPALFPPQDRL